MTKLRRIIVRCIVQVLVDERKLDVAKDEVPREVVGSLYTADSLDDISIRSASERDRFDASLLAHEFAEDGAGRGAVAVVHNDDILRSKGLGGDIASVQVAANVDATTVVRCEDVAQIPADDTGKVVGFRTVSMRTILLSPGGKWLVVDTGVSSVVGYRRDPVLHRGIGVEASWYETGVVADLLADQVERLVCPQTSSAIRQDVGEQLFEQVVALQDRTTSVGRDVYDKLRLVCCHGTVDCVGVHSLEAISVGK